MAWNPSKEVAVARDAAARLDAHQVVIVFTNLVSETMGYASYGANRALCAETKKLADHLYRAAVDYFSDERPANADGRTIGTEVALRSIIKGQAERLKILEAAMCEECRRACDEVIVESNEEDDQ